MISANTTHKGKEVGSDKLTKKLLIFIALFSFLLYANAISNGYNLDDELVTIHHRLTSKGISAIPEIFTSPYYEDNAGNAYEYRPVTLATFALEHQLFGDNAHINHFINVLIYVLTSVILFLTLLKLFDNYNYLLPFVTTLLFVAHPLHTETVAGIKNRDELLSLLGGILSLYYALKFSGKGKLKYYFLFFLFFVFGLLSKKSIIPFALLIPATLLLFNKVQFLRIVLLSLPLSLITGVFWPFSALWQKIIFTVALFIAPVLLYFIINISTLISGFRYYFSKVFMKKSLAAKSNLWSLLESETISSYSLQWILIPLTLILTTVFIYCDQKIFALAYLFILIMFFLHSSKETKSFFLIDIALLLGPFAFFYGLKYLVWFVLFVLFSAYIKGEKKLDLRLILCVILVSPVLFLGHKSISVLSVISIPLTFGILSYLFFRKGMQLFISIGLLLAGLIGTALTFKIKADFVLMFLTGLALAIIHFDKRKIINDPVKLLVLIIPLAFFLNFTKVFWYKVPAYAEKPVKEFFIKKTSQERPSENVVSIANSFGRELNFVEMPVKDSDPLSIKIGTSFFVLGKYFQLLVFPYQLGFYYGYAQIVPVTWTNIYSLISAIIYLIIIASAFYFIKKHPVYSYGVFFYLICISAFSNLAAPVAGIMADRLAFVASGGFCISIGYILLIIADVDIRSPNTRLNFANKKLFLILFVLVLYSAKTFSRNFQWKEPVTLMRNDIKHLDKSVQANNLLAFHLVERSFKAKNQTEKESYLKEAIMHYKRAVELYPKADFAWHDLGQTYILLNNYDDALPAFLKAIEIDSTYVTAWIKAGAVFSKKQNYPEAVRCFEKVLSLDSSNIQVYTSLSEGYFLQKKFEKAIQINLLAVKKMPNKYDPLVNIGKTYFTMGDKRNALIYFEKAYLINPADRNLVLTMGNIYKELGDQKNADLFFSRANQKNR